MTLTITCPCDAEIELDANPGRPARLYGRPEDCYPEEPMQFSPDECPECGQTIDPGTVAEALSAAIQDAKDEAAEHKTA